MMEAALDKGRLSESFKLFVQVLDGEALKPLSFSALAIRHYTYFIL